MSNADLPAGADLSPTAELEQELAGLRAALATRVVIGQATGLLAGVLRISTGEAWDVLRITSSMSNLKLREVARLLVDANDGRGTPAETELAAQISDALPIAVARIRRPEPGQRSQSAPS